MTSSFTRGCTELEDVDAVLFTEEGEEGEDAGETCARLVVEIGSFVWTIEVICFFSASSSSRAVLSSLSWFSLGNCCAACWRVVKVDAPKSCVATERDANWLRRSVICSFKSSSCATCSRAESGENTTSRPSLELKAC